MPTIYLSPSTQEGNFYVNGGTEEEWMNRLADAMEPYLTASGIQYVRNTPDMTAASSIRQANRGYYDLYLALHQREIFPFLLERDLLCRTDLCSFPADPEGICDGRERLWQPGTSMGTSAMVQKTGTDVGICNHLPAGPAGFA